MKILFSSTYFLPYISGITIYIKRVAEELAERGELVTVTCMQHSFGLKSIETVGSVNIVRARPDLKISKGFLSLDWLVQSWKLVDKNDVIVVNLPQVEGWIPAVFAKLMKKKLVSIYHCEIDYQNKAVQLIVEIANHITLVLSEKIIAYTRDYAENSKLLRTHMKKTVCVYPPILKPGGSIDVKKPKGEIWLGMAARLSSEKGFEYLIEALGLLDDSYKLVIAGPMDPVGEEKYKTKILALIRKYEDRIEFLGAVPPEKMGGFYKLIDVLVLPSVNSTEAFGIVQAEAMMCGVPVVATDLPGVRVPVQESGMGEIVPLRDSSAIVQAVTKIMQNKNKYVKSVHFPYEKIFDTILA